MNKYSSIRDRLLRMRLDGFLITDILNIKYLTGFNGSTAMLFVSPRLAIFFTDFRYEYYCRNLLISEELVIVKSDFFQAVKKKLNLLGVKTLGFEYGAQYHVFDRLRKTFHLKPLKTLVEKMRMTKEKEEIESIQLAVKRAESAFLKTKGLIRIGVKEKRIAHALENNLKKAGCRKIPFDIIVASGKNSALPHAEASDRKIQSGDLVIVDWGGEANGYVSDMTRTFLLKGSDIGHKRNIFQVVLEANKKAMSSVKPGIYCGDIDRAAREVIQKRGYGDYFGHATGHGIGLNVHELPSISARSKDMVKNGFTFTIEPGIYISDIGGVRIEDIVTLRNGKRKCLTTLPKHLEIL